MIDRALIFADPGIVNLIKTKTIPVAIDQWNQRRQKDSEGDFYRKIAAQGPRHDFENGTTQGLYMAAADGTFLGYTNNRSPERVKEFFDEALKKHRPSSTSKLKVETQDQRFTYRPPEGGLVVRVQAKVLGGYDEPETQFAQIFQTAVSRDNLWLTKEEHEALAAGSFPERAALRLVRYHLVDNTRGESPLWEAKDVVSQRITINDGRITGHMELKTPNGERSYSADLLGYVKVSQGKVVQLDMVARGDFSGAGQYTGGAPKGKFPLAVSFTLADGTDIADQVPPQGARGWVADYLR